MNDVAPEGHEEPSAESPAPEAPKSFAPSLNYIPGFDGLRGIAVLAVLAHHADIPGFRGGFIGVDVFFMLSGFLITRILQSDWRKRGHVSFARFYERRARRVLPALWTLLSALGLLVAIDPSYVSPDLYFHSAGIAFVFLTQWQIYLLDDLPGPLIHLWSLGWEENFYILWPLLFSLAARRASTKGLFRATAAGVALLTLFRFGRHWVGLPIPRLIWSLSYFRIDTILLGCALALATQPGDAGGPRRRSEEKLAFAALAVLVSVFAIDDYDFFWAGGFTIVAVCTFVIANHLRRRTESPVARLLEIQPLRWTGLISYSLYLWHLPVVWWVNQRGLPGSAAIVLSITLSYLIAALSYYTVESWFRKMAPLKKQWNPEIVAR